MRTEHVAANETFPPISGSLFMNLENSVHSWSIADCLNKLKRPSPSETNCQTSTISEYFYHVKVHTTVTKKDNLLKNGDFLIKIPIFGTKIPPKNQLKKSQFWITNSIFDLEKVPFDIESVPILSESTFSPHKSYFQAFRWF